MERPDSTATVRRLVGVYDADGSLRGELAYFVAARFGRAHCALCDITHGLVRERADWRATRAALPVPFDTYHRDDEPTEARGAHAGQLPVVLASTERGFVQVLGPDELEACGGSAARLVEALEAAVARAGLRWPLEH